MTSQSSFRVERNQTTRRVSTRPVGQRHVPPVKSMSLGRLALHLATAPAAISGAVGISRIQGDPAGPHLHDDIVSAPTAAWSGEGELQKIGVRARPRGRERGGRLS